MSIEEALLAVNRFKMAEGNNDAGVLDVPVVGIGLNEIPHEAGQTTNPQLEIIDEKISQGDLEAAGSSIRTEELDTTLPLNWPKWKKFYNTGVPSLLCFVVALGSSIYTPAIPDVMLRFQVSQTIATLPLTTYVLGLSFGPMISAPISEMFGRLGTYRVSPPIGAIFILASAFSPNITALCLLRFFAGFFGGASLPVSAGTSADLFHPQSRAVSGTWMLYFPFLGPAFGPLVGGYATQHNGWKWSQFSLAIIITAAWIPVFFMEESYLKVVLARRRMKKVESQESIALQDKPPASKLLLGVLFITLLRPTTMLFTEPIVAFFSLYVAFNFAVIFTFFASVPYVYGLVYHFDRGTTGLVFLGIGIGCTLAVPTTILIDRWYYQKEWAKSVKEGREGVVAPEHRLPAAMLGAFGLPIGLFWFGWSARADVHWIVPIIGTIPFAWGNLCIFIGTCLYLIDTYAALTAASAIAANALLRYIMGATFPLFTFTMYEHLGIGWATSVLGFISVAMLPIPWVFFRWGAKIRSSSKFETNKVPAS